LTHRHKGEGQKQRSQDSNSFHARAVFGYTDVDDVVCLPLSVFMPGAGVGNRKLVRDFITNLISF
jgi:hypothetical protein